jgi:hypothetical protein
VDDPPFREAVLALLDHEHLIVRRHAMWVMEALRSPSSRQSIPHRDLTRAGMDAETIRALAALGSRSEAYNLARRIAEEIVRGQLDPRYGAESLYHLFAHVKSPAAAQWFRLLYDAERHPDDSHAQVAIRRMAERMLEL